MPDRTVQCPRCGRLVDVPASGEKVRCACGQKFRFDAAPPDAADQDEGPLVLDLADDQQPADVPANEVRCPRCGRMVSVPTTGEKVWCECGQKFRFDAAEPAPEEAAEPEAGDEGEPAEAADGEDAEPAANEVECPRCGNTVAVPTTGEKVHCPQCGQKFRFDVPAEGTVEERAKEPLVLELEPPDEEPASEVTCPRCGRMVAVPTSGEKVRCPGCGQKFRFEVPQGPEAPAEEPLVLDLDAGEAGASANEIECPRCGRMVAVPTSGEKVHCPGCGQKFRFEVPQEPEAPREEPPAELPEIAPPAEALPGIAPPGEGLRVSEAETGELRSLWPLLCQFVSRLYEEGEATAADRRLFRDQADRAAELARRVLPPPGPDDAEAHQVLTAVLPETTLDEIVALSLEDFRHLRTSLDEAQGYLDRQLPQPEPERPAAPARPAPRPPRTSNRAAVLLGVAALLGIGVGAVVAAFVIRAKMRGDDGRQLSWAEILGVKQPGTIGPPPPTTSTVEQPVRPAPATDRATTARAPGTDTAPTPRRVDTSTVPVPRFVEPAPRTSTAVPPPPMPRTDTMPMKRVLSRWRPDGDGLLRLFDGRSLDGWLGGGDRWTVRDGAVYGVMPIGSATLTAQDAEWADYALAVEAKLGKAGTLVLHHGPLAAMVGSGSTRLGYPGHRWRVLDEIDKGATRNQWYRMVLDAKGRHAELRVDGKVVLSSEGRDPQAGPPALEVQSGGIAVRDARVRLHPSDEAYRAVALGEGWLVPTEPVTPQPGVRILPPGTHTLFNGTNFKGWQQRGAWAVRGGLMVGSAPMSRVSLVSTGSPEWTNYAFRVRGRLTRKTRIAREGEYFLVIVRRQSDYDFFCIRFAIEGIYELGYYHNGRFRETSRARHGLGSDFNKWHDIEITVRGTQLHLEIDGIGGKPPWPIPRHYRRGDVGVGVTGGEAAFGSLRIHLPR